MYLQYIFLFSPTDRSRVNIWALPRTAPSSCSTMAPIRLPNGSSKHVPSFSLHPPPLNNNNNNTYQFSSFFLTCRQCPIKKITKKQNTMKEQN